MTDEERMREAIAELHKLAKAVSNKAKSDVEMTLPKSIYPHRNSATWSQTVYGLFEDPRAMMTIDVRSTRQGIELILTDHTGERFGIVYLRKDVE